MENLQLKNQEKKSRKNRRQKKEELDDEETDTRKEEVLGKEIFKRRESLQRTPPGLQRRASLGSAEEEVCAMSSSESTIGAFQRGRANTLPKDETWGALSRAFKRPREEEGAKEVEELRRDIERMISTIEELSQVTEASTNTKITIRRISLRN